MNDSHFNNYPIWMIALCPSRLQYRRFQDAPIRKLVDFLWVHQRCFKRSEVIVENVLVKNLGGLSNRQIKND